MGELCAVDVFAALLLLLFCFMSGVPIDFSAGLPCTRDFILPIKFDK